MITRRHLQPAQRHCLRRAISPLKAHFGGAEFTPALGTLQLNDGYLNTHFFFLNKLTEVKSEALETNGPLFFHSSKLNHKFWWDKY